MEQLSEDKIPQAKENRDEARSSESHSFLLQRTTSRRLALQLLFAIELTDSWNAPLDLTEEIFNLISDECAEGLSHTILRKSWSRSRKLAAGIAENRQQLDDLISAAAKNWSIQRINEVDRNLIRLATYEMKYATPTVNAGVAINEAVELAKHFGQKDSWRFVNGVLDQIRKTIQQTPFTVG